MLIILKQDYSQINGEFIFKVMKISNILPDSSSQQLDIILKSVIKK